MELWRLAYAKRSFSSKTCVSPAREHETPICALPKWSSRLHETRIFTFSFFPIFLNLRFACARRDLAKPRGTRPFNNKSHFWASRLRQMTISVLGPLVSHFCIFARFCKILRLAYAKWPLWSRRRVDMANNKNNKVPSRLRETLVFDVFSAFLFLLHFHEFASRRDETLTFGGISLIFGPCFCKVPDPTKNANLRLVHARREFSLSEMAFLLRSIVKTCVSSRRNASFRILCCLSSILWILGKF